MSKFTRVSEKIPESIIDALGFNNDTPELERDPYAQLKATAEQRRAAITRELVRSGDRQKKVAVASNEHINWDQINRQDNIASDQDILDKGIRRMSAATDNGENTRDIQSNFVPAPSFGSKTEVEDYVRQASIWNPDIAILHAEAQNICHEMMEENNQAETMKTRRDRLAESRQTKHDRWETEQMARVQDSKVLDRSGRANFLLSQHTPLRCTSTERVSASKFGIPDWQRALERDQKRVEVAERRMTERKAIKRQGYNPEDAWDPSNVQASTYQNHQSDWLNGYLDKME